MLTTTLVSFLTLTGTTVTCGPTGPVLENLKNKYDEAPTATREGANGAHITLFENQDKQTWTLLHISPDGQTCLLGAGRTNAPAHDNLPMS
jgi:hypothetical protein